MALNLHLRQEHLKKALGLDTRRPVLQPAERAQVRLQPISVLALQVEARLCFLGLDTQDQQQEVKIW